MDFQLFSLLNFTSHINGIKFISVMAMKFPPNTKNLEGSSRRISNGGSRVSIRQGYQQELFWRESKFAEPRRHIRASSKGELNSSNGDRSVLIGSAITVCLAVANRVLYKLALVPMKQYPFFMAQVTTFGYVAIYFSILYIRYCAGIVTKEMLALPKSRLMVIGFLESLGVAAGMAAGAMLPGPAIPILSQTFLLWQLIFSVLILKRNYSLNQMFSCLLVAAGVVVAVASHDHSALLEFLVFTILPLGIVNIVKLTTLSMCGANKGQFLSQINFVWPALMITSSACQAGASILKEFVFVDATRHLTGKSLDIFVVNSFGSGFQAIFVFLLLPFLSNLRGIPFVELPTYLISGAACFMNVGANITGCEGAPLLPLLFIFVNMAFNISALALMRNSSAVVASLAGTLSVPLSIYILTLPLPYIPQAASLTPLFIVGNVVLVFGLILYNLPRLARQESKDN